MLESLIRDSYVPLDPVNYEEFVLWALHHILCAVKFLLEPIETERFTSPDVELRDDPVMVRAKQSVSIEREPNPLNLVNVCSLPQLLTAYVGQRYAVVVVRSDRTERAVGTNR